MGSEWCYPTNIFPESLNSFLMSGCWITWELKQPKKGPCLTIYIYIYNIMYNIYIHLWVRLEIPYPHWKVCLGGMLRRYASGFASGVCFGGCFAWTSSHGTYFISKRLPTNFPTFYISQCISLHAYIHIYIYYIYIHTQRERERERHTRMVFWSKSTAKGQSLAFPSTGAARG